MADMDTSDECKLLSTDSLVSVNTSPCDVYVVSGKNRVSTVKRSISYQPPEISSPPSPIYRSSSDGGPKSEDEKTKPILPREENSKLISKFTNWWKTKAQERGEKRKKEQTEEYKMRHKLQYHFMSPFQKYKHGRKPWKLLIQIIKIIIVTTQVILFGAERFSTVFFINHTHEALRYLFIQGYTEPSPYNYFSRQDLANAIIFAKERYNNLLNESIGIYWFDNDNDNVTISLCVEKYLTQHNGSGIIDYSSHTETHCSIGIPYNVDDLLRQFHKKQYFDSLKALYLKFQLRTIFVNGFRMLHRPECYHLKNTLYIDNKNHDGKLRVSFLMEHQLKRCPREFKVTKDATALREFYIAFDILVVSLCFISLLLCARSVTKSIMLASVAQVYFKEYKGEVLTKWDLFELINKWFIVLVLSDLLSIIGSLYKIRVDYRDIHYYNICSVFLGIGVLLVWVGILRFFTYLPNYNILLIALRVAAPNLMRFMICALFIFFGFTFCGWIVLGPYHVKFDSFSKTCDCLYSLLNGDDMYVTFNEMSQASTAVWIFSKIYLYIFISLFIYVVLSTFISIVSDSYERMKFSGKMPPTKIESFMAGKTTISPNLAGYCDVCSQESELPESSITTLYGSMENNKDLSSSQLSILSASLD